MKGIVPLMMTLEKLRQPHGPVPGNPLIAESLYLTKYIERMGTGVGDMIERCRNVGLLEPEFYLTDGFVTIIRRKPELALRAVTPHVTPQVAPQVTPPVEVLLRLLDSRGALSNTEIRKGLGLKDQKHMGERYLGPALAEGLVELTIPDKLRSSLQKYRLTTTGKALLEAVKSEGKDE
jgi:ATP-dependent DNA helicase RecG